MFKSNHRLPGALHRGLIGLLLFTFTLGIAPTRAAVPVADSPRLSHITPQTPTANGWAFTPVATVGQNGFTSLSSAAVGDSSLVVVAGVRNGQDGIFIVNNDVITTVATVGMVLSDTQGTINYIHTYPNIGIDPDNRVVFIATVTGGSLAGTPTLRWSNGVLSPMLPFASNAGHFPSAMNSRGQWLVDVYVGNGDNGTHNFKITDGVAVTDVISLNEISDSATCHSEDIYLASSLAADGTLLYYQEVRQTAMPEPGICNPSDWTLDWTLAQAGPTSGTVASGQLSGTQEPGFPSDINGTKLVRNASQLSDNGALVYAKDTFINAEYTDEPITRELILRDVGETVLLENLNLESVSGLDNAHRVALKIGNSLYAGPNLATARVISTGDALFGQPTTYLALNDVSAPLATSSDQRVFAFRYVLTNGAQGIATATKPHILPVIFLHGIGGSTLEFLPAAEKIWIGLTYDPPPAPQFVSRRKLSLLDSPPVNVIATDVIRTVAGVKDIYEPLLDYLTETGGYVEYDVAGDPARRTTDGCHMAQQANQPTLFVFAYDWRVDNATHAAELRDYIGCVRRLYPDSEVNLLTHSMGGLVARRYILDYYDSAEPTNSHYVNTLVTIAAPWLGAAEPLYALETGRFIPHIADSLDFKYAAESLTAAHQLFASRVYEQVSGVVPLAETGWDLDADGEAREFYSYQNMLQTLNTRYPNTSGTTTDLFHSHTEAWGGQDNWQGDSTGVKYYHLYGLRGSADTTGQVQATNGVSCPLFSACVTTYFFRPALTIGDGTVPHRSATRMGNGLDFNAPNALLFGFFGPNDGGDDLVEHTGLTENVLVQASVVQLLSQATSPVALADATRLAAALAEEPIVPARYLLLNGGATVVTHDALGNSTAPLQGDLLDRVPGVTSLPLGEHIALLIWPTTGEYTVTFTTTVRPLALEVTTGTGLTFTELIRYLDVTLPVSVSAMLHQTPNGVEALRYDADSNGTFETVVTPTIQVSDTVALDVTPPTVAISFTTTADLTTRLVTLSAQDNGVGLKHLLYSLDGLSFQLYTTPFTVTMTQTPVVYAFADDLLSNRSPRVQAPVPRVHQLALPFIRR